VAFEIPLSAVSNSNMAGKNEVALDFNPPPVLAPLAGVKPERPADELVEMRFYIPQRSTGKKSRTGSQAGGSDDEDEEEVDPEDVAYDSDGNEISAAEIFHKTIMDQAELGEQAGDAIASFTDVSVVTPRSVHGRCWWDCRSQLTYIVHGLSLCAEVDTISRCTRSTCDCMERLTTTRCSTSIFIDSSSCQEQIRCTSNFL